MRYNYKHDNLYNTQQKISQKSTFIDCLNGFTILLKINEQYNPTVDKSKIYFIHLDPMSKT